ncbi:hypothetical protein [Streptomyces sp. SID2888]|uniref:hypothetical protein n=1 Tax=Streptomyces sp. SID2888 TaxID=2690256 RepID=UPI00137186F0|nr:hypothetical protein [Streptomyces sp. SID2888]MYV45433.1 hypothetical protein [Streptomyces sp. SID2888]
MGCDRAAASSSKVAGILATALLGSLTACAFAAPVQAAPRPSFDQKLVDTAVAAPLIAFPFDQVRPGTNPAVVGASKNLYFLALTANISPGARASDGTKVRDRLVAQVHHLVAGGNEPDANGGLEGWSHNAVAQALTLVHATPAVWAQLDATDRSRVDLLMRSMAVAANWSFNDPNDFYTALDQLGNFQKTYNANYREGYVGVAVAADLYFGPEKLNKIFTGFSYDAYVRELTGAGFTSILATWEKTGKNAMENGAPDCCGGKGAGVRQPFVYQGVPLDDPVGIFEKLAAFTYDQKVSSSVGNGTAYIADGTTSPYQGRDGMLHEFDSSDSKGLRSDALYSYEGWMNSVTTRATMTVLGAWGQGPTRSAVEDLMEVGSGDLIYKMEHGYQGYANGAPQFVGETAPASNGPSVKGWFFDKAVWQTLLARSAR